MDSDTKELALTLLAIVTVAFFVLLIIMATDSADQPYDVYYNTPELGSSESSSTSSVLDYCSLCDWPNVCRVEGGMVLCLDYNGDIDQAFKP